MEVFCIQTNNLGNEGQPQLTEYCSFVMKPSNMFQTPFLKKTRSWRKETKNFLSSIGFTCQVNQSKIQSILEKKMYTTEKTNDKTPTIPFYNLYNLSQNETDSNLTSRMEIAFLSDSGAFNWVLDIPTYKMITQIFNVCNHDQHEKCWLLQVNLKFQSRHISL